VFDHIAEELEIIDLIVAPNGAALHSRTTFTTIKDWPDFELWPTMTGDVRVVESINMYLTANGKITKIKSGRFSDRFEGDDPSRRSALRQAQDLAPQDERCWESLLLRSS
jgi:hypothetical protein